MTELEKIRLELLELKVERLDRFVTYERANQLDNLIKELENIKNSLKKFYD